MIIADNFKVSRHEARARLDPAVARDSFGYFIDFVNLWESYRNPEEILNHLGIHRTHIAQFPELLTKLGRLTERELDWARRYVEFYERVGRLISTTSTRPELQYDIAETAFDWRVAERYVTLPARIIDYGAGCGRQCTSAFLRHPDNIYTAIDSTLAAYTVQNLVFSFWTALRERRVFTDLLDLQLAGEAMPDIRTAAPGSIFHMPAWFDHANLPARYYDLMFACHVHTELSGSDFRRLVAVANRCLSDEGVLYVRSELAIPFPKGYFEGIDLHGQDIVRILKDLDFAPVFCTYEYVFQTSVFARVGSSHYQKAVQSTDRETQFLDLPVAMDLTVLAGRHFAERQLESIVERGLRVILSGKGFDIFESLVTQFLDRLPGALVLDYGADLTDPATSAAIRDFKPEVVVTAGPDPFGVLSTIQAAAGGDFALTLHHVMPMCYSYREFPGEREPALINPVRVIGDLERNLGLPPQRARVADGAGLLVRAGDGAATQGAGVTQ